MLFLVSALQTGFASTWKEQIEADWVRQDAKRLGTGEHSREALSLAITRGLQLAKALGDLEVEVLPAVSELRHFERELARLPKDASRQAVQDLYHRARWKVRELALSNPLLPFERILFVKRAPGMFPHMSDQFYGWWSRPGGGVYVLENFKSGPPVAKCLTASMPLGSVLGPDLSFDATRILFAACKYYPGLADEQNKAYKSRVPEDAFYHVFEMQVDGSGLRRLTSGKYDDFDPRYLPNGDIAFLSTRKGTAIQCNQWFSDSTREVDHPDSYVRCGGDNYRPVPVFTLHSMGPSGRPIRPLSAFENFEWSPSVAEDGRILYTRWDYIDRFNGHFFSLWSANQDGTNPQLVYGNYTVKPQVAFEARSIPRSSKIVFTAAAHHSSAGGTICLLDRDLGTEGGAPIRRLTPDARFPETEENGSHYYASPWPLSEQFFLVGWADAPLPPHGRFEDEKNPVNAMGLYLLDAFGNLELLYRDPAISSVYPIPLAPRPEPARRPQSTHADGDQNCQVLVQDIYQGLEGVHRGSVSAVRIVGVLPKTQPLMNNPVLGVSTEDPGKFVLGTVPVEPDGSAYFRLPPGIPVFFQALSTNGMAVQTMRTLTYAMPGQVLSCIGCHESRESAPHLNSIALATLRGPSPIEPGPDGCWPLSFDTLVQPVLDRYCVECHSPTGKLVEAQGVILVSGQAYQTLVSFADEDIKKRAFERDRSLPNEGVAASSRLWQMLAGRPSHQGLTLDGESLSRIVLWLDTYAHRLGYFSEQQKQELVTLRKKLAPLLSGN